MAYINPEDIANRCLQHLGASLISSFSDNSKNAVQTSFAYDKLIQSEMRRRVWQFAIRRHALRSVILGSAQTISFLGWTSGATFNTGDIVSHDAVSWITVSGPVTNITPGGDNFTNWQEFTGPSVCNPWSATISYFVGELVSSGSSVYLSLVSGNTAILSVTTAWHLVQGAIHASLFIPFPVANSTNSALRNIFPIPDNFLRIAPQDPKAPGNAYSATSAGMQYSDYSLEREWLLSAATDPIIFRYVMNAQFVRWYDPLFCEMVAARMAYDLCEMITGSAQKKQLMTQTYGRYLSDAQQTNAVESGTTEPADDEWSSLRGGMQESNARLKAPQQGQPQR